MKDPNNKKIETKESEEERIDSENITDDQIEDWIITSLKVLGVLKEEESKVYEKVYIDFLFDLQRLKDKNRISADEYDAVLEKI